MLDQIHSYVDRWQITLAGIVAILAYLMKPVKAVRSRRQARLEAQRVETLSMITSAMHPMQQQLDQMACTLGQVSQRMDQHDKDTTEIKQQIGEVNTSVHRLDKRAAVLSERQAIIGKDHGHDWPTDID